MVLYKAFILVWVRIPGWPQPQDIVYGNMNWIEPWMNSQHSHTGSNKPIVNGDNYVNGKYCFTKIKMLLEYFYAVCYALHN